MPQVFLLHNTYRQPGGEDAVVAAEAGLLRRRGHAVGEYQEDNHRIEAMAGVVVAAETLWSRGSKARVGEMLRRERWDVAHFHNTFPLISPSAYYACREAGVPVVQTLHNYRLLCPSATFYREGKACEDCLGKTPPWPGVVHGCYRESRAQTAVVAGMLTLHRWLNTWRDCVDVYIALTEFARRKFIEGGLPPEKIMVKPNFVAPDPGERSGYGTYALFVGRLSPEKGLVTLLRAWHHIKGIPLKIAGDGPLKDELRRLVQELSLDQSVELLGRESREAVMARMKEARMLLFPSECFENFPVSIAEAFACGVPVISADHGAMAEIVADRKTGLMFTPGDAEDLAAKAEWAWNHPEQMRAMGREARAEYESKYTAERNYKMLMEIYKMAIERYGVCA